MAPPLVAVPQLLPLTLPHTITILPPPAPEPEPPRLSATEFAPPEPAVLLLEPPLPPPPPTLWAKIALELAP